jgi:DNA replication initiation complex subunit (GINS family)
VQKVGESGEMTDRYSRLLEAWRKENKSGELQALQDNFFGEMTEYLAEIRGETRMLDKTSLKGRITEKEQVNAERLLKELSSKRLRKIVEAELDRVAIAGSSLTQVERSFLSDLRSLLMSHEGRLKDILMGRVPQVDAKPPQKAGLKVVRFLQAVPAIMGIDMKTYGPFEPEDVVSLPVENAENLIRRGIAKEVEISK